MSVTVNLYIVVGFIVYVALATSYVKSFGWDAADNPLPALGCIIAAAAWPVITIFLALWFLSSQTIFASKRK